MTLRDPTVQTASCAVHQSDWWRISCGRHLCIPLWRLPRHQTLTDLPPARCEMPGDTLAMTLYRLSSSALLVSSLTSHTGHLYQFHSKAPKYNLAFLSSSISQHCRLSIPDGRWEDGKLQISEMRIPH